MSDELRDALRSLAAEAGARAARPPAAELRHRLTRHRVRVVTSAVVASSLTAVLSAAAFDRLAREDGTEPFPPATSGTPSASSSPDRSPAPSPTAARAPSPSAVPPPTTIVAGPAEDPPFVLLSARTGNVMRRVEVNHGEGPVIPVVSFDRKTIYFSRILTSCQSEVVAVPVNGGPERHIGYGWAPAISPDGQRIAYIDDADCTGNERLVVKDLGTGAERRWTWGRAAESEQPFERTHNLFGLAWAPDSRHLAYVRDQVPAAGAQPRAAGVQEVSILDTEAAGTSLDAGRKILGQPDGGYLTTQLVYRGRSGGLLALQKCCDASPSSRLVEVDVENGEQRVVYRFDQNVGQVDFDNSGQHLLYVADEDTLYRWADRRPVEVARNVYGADW